MPATPCPAGTTCTDFREYTDPSFSSNAKPIFNSPPGGATLLQFASSTRGGVRLLNLKLQGNGQAGNDGIFLYNGAHDITACNLDIDGFSFGIDHNGGNPPTAANPNITITGNTFSNNTHEAYFGAGPNAEVSHNIMFNNGGYHALYHSIYLGSAYLDAPSMNISENYVFGQNGPTCDGVVIVAHGRMSDLLVKNNVLEIEASASAPGCYGISLDHGSYSVGHSDFSRAIVSGNTVINAGYVGIGVSHAPDSIIENNLLVFDVPNSNGGIAVASYSARVGRGDAVNTRTVVKNNTIWFGPNSTSGIFYGVAFLNEGDGYVSANNSVTFASTNTGAPVTCYSYLKSGNNLIPALPLASSYAFVNNNHCYSAAPSVSHYAKWEATADVFTYYDLAAWRTYSGFDLLSIIDPPKFVNSTSSPYDFHPDPAAPASPLLGAGSTVYAPTTATDISGTNFLNPPVIGAYE